MRAIWKGKLTLGKEELAVKLYSAISDRAVHFRLLHAADRTPVEQRIVRKADGNEVDKESRRKAYPISADKMVVLQPKELAELQPEESREIALCRFVTNEAVADTWYDRPYFLGPDGNSGAYFALAEALERADKVGIARWAMRKARYVGALRSIGGYLLLVTLRRSEQLLTVANVEVPASKKPSEAELKLAQQLVESIEGPFEPYLWPNEHHQRVCELIAAKARGDKIKLVKPKVKRAGGDLAEQLQRSLQQMERKVA